MTKTAGILRSPQDCDLRRRVKPQLHRGEQRHGLARWIFFANQGDFRTGDYPELMNKASCLSFGSSRITGRYRLG